MSSRARWTLVAATVFVVGCALRLGVVLASRGGPAGNFGYDPGVYYSAADALTFGRLPYRDFVLLHPPGLMLVGVPFAAIGRLTTDHTGFVVANTTFAVLGAFNAVLVVAVARRAQLSLYAAALGGLFYAAWNEAVSAEVSFRLEPLGGTAFLCGLLVLTSTRLPRSRALMFAGAAFGFAVSVKVWWIVPVLIVLAWHLRPGRRRESVLLAAGALAAGIVVDGPFFLAAPRAMWRMVVTDQLGRHRILSSPFVRLDRLTSLHSAFPKLSTGGRGAALILIALLAALLVLGAWRVRSCRLVVVIAAAQVLVLLVSPSYFSFYADYSAPASALVVAAAAHSGIAGWRRPRAGRLVLAGATLCVVLAVVSTGTALLSRTDTGISSFPGPALAAAAAHSRCVMADSPMALIELNALSRDLAHGCADWVDVSGRTYDVDAPPGGQPVRRAANAKWQTDLEHYLLSGNAVITIRSGTGYGPAARRLLAGLPVLARVGHIVLHRVPGLRAGY